MYSALKSKTCSKNFLPFFNQNSPVRHVHE